MVHLNINNIQQVYLYLISSIYLMFCRIISADSGTANSCCQNRKRKNVRNVYCCSVNIICSGILLAFEFHSFMLNNFVNNFYYTKQKNKSERIFYHFLLIEFCLNRCWDEYTHESLRAHANICSEYYRPDLPAFRTILQGDQRAK